MEDLTMKKHVTLVAALQIGFSTMGIIVAMIVFFIFSFAGSFVHDVDVAESVLKFLGVIIPTLIIMSSLFGLIGGIGLLGYHKWARIVVLIVAAIGCLNFPLGTIKGVYSIWVLMQDEAMQLFH
jgi:O-antigen/teichoic acid export membrane protein